MSEHLEKNELKIYGESNLSPREFLRVQAHFETCEDCTRRLNEMFPNIVEREEALLLEELTQETMRDFHLNYDEHLKPFIYGTIDAVDKEIVESHVEICAECREDLRDLLTFHEELEREKTIRELSKANWWTHLTDWFSQPNHKAVWLALTTILIFISVGLAWFFRSKSSDEITQRPANIGKNENVQTAPNINSNQGVIEANRNSNPLKTDPNTPNQPEKEVETANLVLPIFLDDLRLNKNDKPRGNGGTATQKIAVISPNGLVIRDSSPVLTWQNVPNIQTYEVAVFDENNNLIAKSENVSDTSWRVPNLSKGKIYQWQVSAKTVSADGKTQNFLGQGKFYVVSERDENHINQAKNALERGRAFAETGLLKEAESEFRTYLKENPNSENAKKFLRQVEQRQR